MSDTRTLTPRRIFALGLTYREHAREAGLAAATPERFDKPLRSWLPDGDEVTVPSRAALVAAIAALDPALAADVDRGFPALPALMDYEVEIGIAVLADIAPGARRGRLGYFVANDLTARTLQILGEGAPEPLRFWSAAKGFDGFLPVGATLFEPSDDSLERMPELPLETRVNGTVRQSASTTALAFSPADLLARAAGGGPLARGDVILTGTPAGIALQVPAWKRRVAGLLPGRLTRLRLALRSYRDDPRFLRPGDEVIVSAGPLGARRVQLVDAFATVAPAAPEDAPALLSLQRRAYASEAERYGDPSIPPMIETLDELRAELARCRVLTLSADGRLVGAVRARLDGDTVAIGRLVVDPDCQGRGYGRRLLRAAEASFPGAARAELFTGADSERNLRLYAAAGYRELRRQPQSPRVMLVYLEKRLAPPV